MIGDNNLRLSQDIAKNLKNKCSDELLEVSFGDKDEAKSVLKYIPWVEVVGQYEDINVGVYRMHIRNSVEGVQNA